jgi:hypothetical protein
MIFSSLGSSLVAFHISLGRAGEMIRETGPSFTRYPGAAAAPKRQKPGRPGFCVIVTDPVD